LQNKMPEQTLQLRQTMYRCKQKASVIAITSGKGGVGKTSIAANLGVCLAAKGRKTVLFDADLSLGNLNVMMNLHNKYNIRHFINGRKSLEEITHTTAEGLDIICGASGFEKLADMSEFQQKRLLAELTALQNNYQTIIVDTAAGISRSVICFLLACDNALVVTTPEPTAMTDAYAMIKVLVRNKFRGRISLIVNMSRTTAEGKKIYRKMADVVTRFLGATLYDSGTLLKDDRISQAVRMRKPVVLAYPKAPVTYSLATLASRISDNPVQNGSRRGFFHKVARLLF